MIYLLSFIALVLSFALAMFPRFCWYYVLSGHWGRNPLGAPSEVQLLVVRFLSAIPVLAYRYLILG